VDIAFLHSLRELGVHKYVEGSAEAPAMVEFFSPAARAIPCDRAAIDALAGNPEESRKVRELKRALALTENPEESDSLKKQLKQAELESVLYQHSDA
jgi:hypothetical protein